ncbi:MAG: L-threonylcarbamoyladenylate synthase [Timaviella obliquedivisa GSE-PSE-MK23-08B]|jgi:L-threonylcarbamoyladenylate synthase|nr:L-threonylcarbamoyladenylate synthase [Timaviella obliquedivisa GSE-PSE-MK23-08B]
MPSVSLNQLIAAARSGDRLISFPTDTLPALAVRPERSTLIFEAKQRSLDKPLILMGADATDLWEYVQGSAAEMDVWQSVAAQYFPGALTLVLPASDRLPLAINPTNPTTIGIRVPNNGVARYILTLTRPLATTSVNHSGEPPLETLSDINTQFPEILTLSSAELAELESTLAPFNSTPIKTGTPSTVAKWTGQGFQILRQGEIKLET